MGIIWENDFSNHWIFGLFHATRPRWPQPAQGGPRAKLHVLGFPGPPAHSSLVFLIIFGCPRLSE